MKISDSHDARSNIRRALAVVFVNRYAVLGINLGAMMIIARLVTPAETGLFSVAASIVLLAQAMRDFGIAEFLIQEKDLTQAKIRTAFGMTLVLAWSVGALIFLFRGWAAELYHAPELSSLLAVVCGSFLVVPFSSTTQALLNRRMDFVAMLKISIPANIANALVSVGLAYCGWGAMALSLGMLANNVVTAVIASLFLRSKDHFIPSLGEWRRLASFGLYASSTNIIAQIGGRVPELIIGRLLGFEPLGQFNRARGVVALFFDLIVSGVNTVAFPAFAAAHRAGEDVRLPYLRATTMITGTVFPVMALLSITAEPLVQFMLGSQWIPAARIIPLIALGTAICAMAPIVGPVMTATGGIRFMMRSTLYSQAWQLILTGVFVEFGTVWLACGQIVYGAIYLVISAHFLKKAINLQSLSLIRASLSSIPVTLASAVLPLGYKLWFVSPEDSALLTLMIACFLSAASWLASVVAFRHPMGSEIMVLGRQAALMVNRSG